MSDPKPGRGSDQFPLRFPDGMRDIIKNRADSSGRSMNAEIIAILESAIDNPPELVADLKKLTDMLDDECEILVGDLREKVEELEEAKKENVVLKDIVDKGFEFQQRLMYHVLNYIDDIPTELSLWAFDMAQIATRPKMPSEKTENSLSPETDARRRIIQNREAFKARARKALMEHLSKTQLSNFNDTEIKNDK